MRSDCFFFCPVRVRFGEVDRQGIVYNGNYVVYTDLPLKSSGAPRGTHTVSCQRSTGLRSAIENRPTISTQVLSREMIWKLASAAFM